MFLLTEVFHVKELVYCIKQFCLSCNESRQACFVTLRELLFIVLSVAVPVICGMCIYVCMYICLYVYMYISPLFFCLSYIYFFVNESKVEVPVHVMKACGWQ